MNKFYRSLWNEITRTFVAVSENVSSRSGGGATCVAAAGSLGFAFKPTVLALVAAGMSHAASPVPTQLPTNPQVVAGQVNIRQSGAMMNVQQDSARAVVDWSSFNVGGQATVNFNLPSRSSAILNRVLDANPSQIFGSITGNGQIFLTNPNGIYFGRDASIDVGAFAATTHAISNADFMAGKLTFARQGATGKVENSGRLRAGLGGYIALLAPEVRNSGVVVAEMGTVALAAGEAYELQFDNGRLANVRVEPTTMAALVENGHAVKAPGGLVILSALAANKLQGSVVRSSGELSASSLTERGGVIRLEGDHIALAGTSRTLATGGTGGGVVRVGGEWQGGGGQSQATITTMEPGAVIDVSATRSGDGGTAVLWSDIRSPDSQTRAQGTLFAQGGPEGGDGGRIETSGHWLDVRGIRIDASASRGRPGVWLLDPYNVTIGSSVGGTGYSSNFTPGADSTILASDIATALNAGTSVTITTGTGGASAGDITVASAITKVSGNTDVTLTLQAANHILIDQAIANTGGSGKLHVVLDADNDNGTRDGKGVIFLSNDISTGGGNLSFGTGATATVNGVSTKVGGDVFVAGSGARSLSTAGGSVTVNGETFIANTSGLSIGTAGGNVTFGGILNTGNSYALDGTLRSWVQASNAATSGNPTSFTAVNDRYLATITSRLENALVARVAGSGEAWIGGFSGNFLDPVTGVYTLWRWYGAEPALSDFYSAGAPVAGRFNNWAPGAAPPVSIGQGGGTTTAVFIDGASGLWRTAQSDDAGATTSTILKRNSVWETNLAPAPLTIDAGAGTVTFAGAVGGQRPLGAVSVTASTIAINGGAVSTAGATTFAGNVTLGSSATTLARIEADGDFILQSGRTITNATGANAALTIKAARDVVLEDSSAIGSTTGRLSVVLNSDTDRTGGGAILLRNGVSISSNGGAITLGGGTAGNGSGNAVGAQTPNQNVQSPGGFQSNDGVGIRLGRHTSRSVNANVSLSSAGGDITLRGEGASASNLNSVGVLIAGGTTIDSGTGTIQISGFGKGGGAANNTSGHGVDFAFVGPDSGIRLYSSAPTPKTAINVVGDATGSTNPDRFGIQGYFGSDKNQIVGDSSGSILLTGINNTGYGISIHNMDIVSRSGAITLDGGVRGIQTKLIGNAGPGPVNIGYSNKAGSPITSSSSSITLKGDQLSLHTSTRIQATGGLTLVPSTAGASIGVAGGAGTLQIPAAYFADNFVQGFNTLFGLSVGSTSITGNITTGALTTTHPLKLQTQGNVVIGGALDMGSQTLGMVALGQVTQTAPITAGVLSLFGGSAGSFTLAHPGNRVGALTGSVGSLRFVNAEALNVGVLLKIQFGQNIVYGPSGLEATGPVSIETLSGDLTLSIPEAPPGSLSYPVPQVVLKTTDASASAVVLNAGSGAAAGDATGGNVILAGAFPLSGPFPILTGNGGRATLFTGSVAGSSGVETFVGAGSGRFRYNSDESATNFTAALGSGPYAIFREQPALKVTPTSTSSTYGDTTSLAGVSYQVVGANGDNATSAGVTGTPSFSTTATNGSNAGTYDIAYLSGLSNTMGYAVVDNVASTGEYTVTPRPITVTAANQSRTYGSANPTAGAVTLSSGSLVGTDALGTATVAAQGTATLTADAGTTHGLTPSAQTFSAGSASNYQVSYSDGTLTITPRPITVAADDQRKIIGGQDPALTWKLTSGNLVNGHSIVGVPVRDSGETVADYPIRQGTLAVTSAGNYDISFVEGVFSILVEPPPPPASPNVPLPGALATVNLDPNRIINLSGSGLTGSGLGGGASVVGGPGLPNASLRAATSVGTSGSTITVNLANPAPGSTARTVAVSVPRDLTTPGATFSFALPADVVAQAPGTSNIQVTTSQGDPNLPSWLTFNKETRTVVATSIPEGALPFQVVITIEGARYVVDITGQR